MALLDMAAETETYFADNWIATQIEYPDSTLDTTGLDTYINLNFAPVTNERIGFNGTAVGRKAHYGMSQVLCYHTNKKLAMKLADDVKTFFEGQSLPKDIYIDIGIDYAAVDLTTFWESKITFLVTQYS